MSDSPETHSDFPEELEAEVFRLADLPAADARPQLEQLCDQHPQHADLIELLSGMILVDRSSTRVVRVGDFEVERELGQGGMGTVYLAAKPGAEPVALKVVRADLASPDLVRRFEREARVLRELRHPTIARFLESAVAPVTYRNGHRASTMYLAMEYVDGRELLAFAARAEFSSRQRVELGARICEGIGYAHRLGVVHRDLKPANVLVVDDGAGGLPKVLDFGIARSDDTDAHTMTLTRTGEAGMLGTAPYMSPEQVASGAKGLDARSDVYSLGVVLFELLTGRLPYTVDSQSLPEIARVILETDPTRLGACDSQHRGSPLEVILATALEKEPERRYADAEALGQDLRNYLDDQPIRARQASALRRARRFTRRHKVLVSTATGTLLALIVGLVFSIQFALEEAESSRRARRLAYRASIGVAHANRLHADLAEGSLRDAPEELRGWEWHYLSNRLDQSIRRSRPVDITDVHRDTISFGALSGSTTYGHAASANGRVLWRIHPDTDAFEVVQRIPYRLRMAYSHDTQTLAVFDHELHTFPTGTPLTRSDWRHPEKRTTLAAAGAGTFVVFDQGSRVRVFEGNRQLREFRLGARLPGDIHRAVASSSARWAAYRRSRHALWFVRLEAGAKPIRLQLPGGRKPSGIAADPRGSKLAIGGAQGLAGIWRVPKEGPPELFRRLIGHRDRVAAITFDATGQRVATGGDHEVRVWDATTGDLLHAFGGPRRYLSDVAFADEHHVVSIDTSCIARTWSLRPDPAIVPHPGEVTAIEFLRDRVYTASRDGAVRSFDLLSSEPVAAWQLPHAQRNIANVEASPDGRVLVLLHSGSPGMTVVDAETGQDLAHPEVIAHARHARGIAFSPDGTRFVTLMVKESEFVVFRTSDWTIEMRFPADHSQTVRGFAVSPDSRHLLAPGADGAVSIYALESEGARIGELLGRTQQAVSVRFGADGNSVVAVGRNEISRWQWPSRRTLETRRADGKSFTWCADDASGTRYATGGNAVGVDVWDRQTGAHLLTLDDHTDFVLIGAFARGNRLVTASGDATLRIRDPGPPSERREAKRAYREFANRHTSEIGRLIDEQGRSAAPDRLPGWKNWTEREREIATQLRMRALAR